MSRDVVVFLDDILDSIDRIQRYTEGLDRDGFLDADQVQDAVLWRLAVIGEAVKNLPESLRDEHPDVRWSDIAGMRDVLVHGYFRVNLERVWRVVEADVPVLKEHTQAILADHA